MKIGVLGTGMVGKTIATKLISLDHEVMMGARDKENESAREWSKQNGDNALNGSFSDTAAFGEIIFNCTAGMHSVEAITAAGMKNLEGKILIDLANPLDFSEGLPPTLGIVNTESLGERIQNTFPDIKVVKALNTVSAPVMINPSLVPGDHTIFIAGNDENAKQTVTQHLKEWFGWKHILDLGDITSARGTEMYLPLWLRMWGALKNPMFNIGINIGTAPKETGPQSE